MTTVAIVFDTETTGTGEHAQIIEAAHAFVIDSPPLYPRIGVGVVERFKPSVPIEFGAKATHHIIERDLEGCRPSSEFVLPAGVTMLIGHNIDFDWTAAGKPKVRRICTLALARSIWPDLDSHSLSALLYFLYGDELGRELVTGAHTAAADVENTARVLHRICEALVSESWKALWEMSEEARIPKFMPFGKHRPKDGVSIPIVDLPRDYLQWILKQGDDMDPYVKIAARRALGVAA